MRQVEKSGAEGAVWDALLANLDDEDREHAERRVFESIEEDRSKALLAVPDEMTPDDSFEDDAETADT